MSKIKINLFYNMIYQILILIIPLITTPYVSRVLLPEGVGTYSITTAITKYFWLFAHLGLSIYGNRCISKVKDDNNELSTTFSNIFYFQLINSVLFLILYIAYILIFGFDIYGKVILCQIPYMISSLIEISWFFYGTEQFKYIVLRNTLIKIITFFSIFIFVKDSNDVWVYALINSLSLFIGQLCLWPSVLRMVKLKKPQRRLILSHFKPNCILFISFAAVSVYTLMDKVMIDLLSSTVQLGYYENSYKIMDICCSLVGAIGAVMLPRISYLVEKNNVKQINSYLDKSMKYIMLFAIGLSFGMAGIGKEFASLYFGKSFEACGMVMMIISPTIIFYSWENILRNQYLLPSNKDIIFVKATIFAAITNLIINSIFISKYGAIGAAFGTVCALFVSIFYQTFKVRKELKIIYYLKNNLIFVIFALIMFLYCRMVSVFVDIKIICLILQIFGGMFIYVFLSILYLFFIKDDLVLNLITFLKSKIGIKI